jgi:toxin ParE1/3/4
MRVRLSSRAQSHLAAIRDYLKARDAASAAAHQSVAIRAALELLSHFPRFGHVGIASGTYEWVVRGTPYVIVHEIHHGGSDELMVLGVFRGTQDRP